MALATLGLMLAGYLLGSVPFSFLVAKTRGIDLRNVGSGNTGASNVWRNAGFSYFLVALALDILKGWLPTWLAHSVFDLSPLATIVVGLCTILGHVYPIFMRFRGGKAVATSAGVILGFAPVITLIGAIVWSIVYRVSGYPSVASMTDAVVVAIVGTLMTVFGPLDPIFAVFLWIAGAYIFYLHRANIQRLMRGQEIGIGSKR